MSNPIAPTSTDLIPTVLARLLYPKVEAAILLGISERSIDYLISSRRLKTKRIGGRNLVPADELRRFVRADHPEHIRPTSQSSLVR
jgi:excisionase family DNA binding protein